MRDRRRALCLVAGLLLGAGLAACDAPRPRPIVFGEEPCTHCHMTIADSRFSAEAITTTGKVYVFDDIGCLTTWLTGAGTPIRRAWVASFIAPGQWIAVDSASYLETTTRRTPMASGLIALRDTAEADRLAISLGGTRLSWEQVRTRSHAHAVAS